MVWYGMHMLQMLINRHSERGNPEDLTKAVECLELVHRTLPTTFDVLRVSISINIVDNSA